MPSYRAYLDSFKNLTTSPPAAPPSFGNFFETTEGFAASDAFDDEQSVATCYIFIFVWGMINVAAPVWKPETPSQTACMCVVVVFSVANNAAIFGSVVNAIVNITAYRNEERLRRKAIEKWCHDNSIPRALLKRIHAYYDSVGGVQHRAEDKLPPAMPRGIVFQLELYERRRLLLELRPQLTQEEVVDLVPKVSAHGRRHAARKWAARAKGGVRARVRRGARAVEETEHRRSPSAAQRGMSHWRARVWHTLVRRAAPWHCATRAILCPRCGHVVPPSHLFSRRARLSHGLRWLPVVAGRDRDDDARTHLH